MTGDKRPALVDVDVPADVVRDSYESDDSDILLPDSMDHRRLRSWVVGSLSSEQARTDAKPCKRTKRALSW
jgi:hypothetical protein